MAVVDDSSSDGSLAETPPTAHIPFADAFGAAKHLKGVTGQRKKTKYKFLCFTWKYLGLK